MRKLRYRRWVIAILVLALIMVVGRISEQIYAAEPQPKFLIQIAGQSVELIPDRIVTTGAGGAPLIDGSCDIPDFSLEAKATRDFNEGAVEVRVTDQCDLRVIEAEWTRYVSPNQSEEKNHLATAFDWIRKIPYALFPTSIAHAHHGIKIQGWAKTLIHDFIERTLASAYAELKYWDYGSGVHDGHDRDHRCYHWPLTGWEIDNCESDWSFDGPSIVYSETIGAFHNDNCVFGDDACARELTARFTGRGLFQGDWDCFVSHANAPPFTHYHCRGGWETVD